MSDYQLINNKEKKRYEFQIDEHIAVIEYIKSAKGEVFLTHTQVPSELEGKGIGSSLVLKVLQDIEKQGLRVVPLCPFVAAYIKRHPEWKKLVSEGINI